MVSLDDDAVEVQETPPHHLKQISPIKLSYTVLAFLGITSVRYVAYAIYKS